MEEHINQHEEVEQSATYHKPEDNYWAVVAKATSVCLPSTMAEFFA
jgi:hypothetical protein